MARIRTKLRVKEAEDVIRRRNRELNLLPEIGKELSARTNVKELANVVLKRTAETLGAIQGQMIMLDTKGNTKEVHQISFSTEANSLKNTAEKKLLDHIKESHQGLIIKSTLNDEFWNTEPTDRTRSAVIAPLFGRREILGLLVLTHEQENYFLLEHLLLLQAIASQAAIAIENTQLYENVSQEQKRLEVILQNAAEAILLFDKSNKISVLNPAAQKLFSDYQVVLGQELGKGFGYDTLIQLCEQVQTSGIEQSGEVTWPDGRVFSALLTPIEGSGQLVTLHDVTSFKDLEHLKNEFIATASHDLKNPIMSISGYSDLLSKAGPLNSQQVDFIGHIQSSATNMLELVQNMLELVEIDLHAEKKFETLELSSIIKDVMDEFKIQADKKEISLDLEIDRMVLEVSGNSLQLHQLFRNLIGNAVKYTPNRGSITIRVKPNGQIEVQDTGLGIPAADLPFIFDRFYRVRAGSHNKIEGNGLGLAIVKSIIENHQGNIRVDSEVEKGTCFTITFPYVKN
ncbi:MAG: ATP-binding protein [Anaerolineales bacterium]